jgi:hypothetical protein
VRATPRRHGPMVAAIDSPVDAGRSTFARTIYFVIVMTVRSVVSPKSVVWTITVTEA